MLPIKADVLREASESLQKMCGHLMGFAGAVTGLYLGIDLFPCALLVLQQPAAGLSFSTRQTTPFAYLVVPSMPTPPPFLYVKAGCPWCAKAEDFLRAHKIAYDKVDVYADPAAFDEMKKLSGQSKAPTLNWSGEILADFGPEELEVFLRDRKMVK